MASGLAAPAARPRAQYRAATPAHTPAMRPPSKNHARLRAALLLLLLLVPMLAWAQESLRGMPLLRRFSPEDYNATPRTGRSPPPGRAAVSSNSEGGALAESLVAVECPGATRARRGHRRGQRIYFCSYDTCAGADLSHSRRCTRADERRCLKGKARNVGSGWQICHPEGYFAAIPRFVSSVTTASASSTCLCREPRSFYAQGTSFTRDRRPGFCTFARQVRARTRWELFAQKACP